MNLEASGYDSVLTVVPFTRSTAVPNFAGALCTNQSSNTNEKFQVLGVRRGRAYSVQVGGVNDASGNLEFRFDFIVDRDLDGVADSIDGCDLIKGTEARAGCPLRLTTDSRIRALPQPDGVRLLSLSASSSARSRFEVRCSRGCRRQVKRGRRASFGTVSGKRLRAGTKVEIRITRAGAFGSYIAYRITRGNFKKVERCMNPGSRTLRRRCG